MKIVHYWYDYFKGFLSPLSVGLFKEKNALSVNTNQRSLTILDTDFILTKITSQDDIFVFRHKETSLDLCYLIFPRKAENGACTLKSKVEITWSSFALGFNLNFWNTNLLQVYDLNVSHIERFDHAVDIEGLSVNYVVSQSQKKRKGKIGRFEKIETYEKKGEIETFYLGERDKRKNPYLLTRFYNKVLDSQWRGKTYLYGQYENKIITRIETEYRVNKCKNISFEFLLENEHTDYFLNDMMSYLWFSWYKKQILPKNITSSYWEDQIWLRIFKNEADKKRAYSLLKGACFRLQYNWIPFSSLLKFLVSESNNYLQKNYTLYEDNEFHDLNSPYPSTSDPFLSFCQKINQ